MRRKSNSTVTSIYLSPEFEELLLNKIKCEQVKQHKSSNYDTADGMKAETLREKITW